MTNLGKDRLRMCFCTAFRCNGKFVSNAELRIHKVRSDEIAQEAALKEVERDIVKMTLLDTLSTPATPKSPLTGNKHPQRSSHASSTNSPSVVPKANTSPLPPSDIVREEGAFKVLYDFDRQIDDHFKEAKTVLAEWDPNGALRQSMEARFSMRRDAAKFLRTECAWFSDLGARLQCTPARGDDVNRYFMNAMIERTKNISKEIKQHLSKWEEMEAEKEKADNYYNTGE